MQKVPNKVRGGIFMPQVIRRCRRVSKRRIIEVEEAFLACAAALFCRGAM